MNSRPTLLFLLSALLLAAACAPNHPTPSATTAPPTDGVDEGVFPDSAVPYPADYRASFQRFLTVDRPDAVIRDLYINPEAVAALRQGQPLPENTIIVIEGYQAEVGTDGKPLPGADGHYIKAGLLPMLHVIQRRSDWTDADFPSVVRAGKWNFGSFDVQTGARFDEDLATCFNCHQAMLQTDFLYSTTALLRYVRTGEPQYEFCNLRRRLPC